jgi:hypothetical protein
MINITNQQIWDCYWDCATQRMSMSTILSEIHKHQLCMTGASNPTYAKEWHTAIDKFIRQLCIFGYAVYKPSRSLEGAPLVLTGPSVQIERAASGPQKWKMSCGNDLAHIKTTTGWRLVIYAEPELRLDDSVMLTSPGAVVYADSRRKRDFIANALKRDEQNSVHGCFTSVNKNISTSTAQAMPTFDYAHGQFTQSQVTGRSDQATMQADREEMIKTHDAYSEVARRTMYARHALATNDVYSIGVGSIGKTKPKPQTRHVEHFVTDGMDATALRHLQGPDQLLPIIENISTQIAYGYYVPPQVMGKPIGAERNATANAMQSKANELFMNNINRLRDLLDVFLAKGSHKDVQMVHRTCLSAHTLKELEGVLTTKYCKEMYVVVHGVPAEGIDEDALRTRQMVLNGEQSNAERVDVKTDSGAGHKAKTNNRPTTTNAQKEERANKRVKPSD